MWTLTWEKVHISCIFVILLLHANRGFGQTMENPGELDESFLRDLQESELHEDEERYREFLSSRQQSAFIPIPAITPEGEEPIYTASYEDERLKEAKNAHYAFSESIQDTINDHAIERIEERDGLKLKGQYSYSDGFFRRTVHYEADEDGYRVINEDIEPIGDGPKYNPKGKATVETSLAGRYTITPITPAENPQQQRKVVAL